MIILYENQFKINKILFFSHTIEIIIQFLGFVKAIKPTSFISYKCPLPHV